MQPSAAQHARRSRHKSRLPDLPISDAIIYKSRERLHSLAVFLPPRDPNPPQAALNKEVIIFLNLYLQAFVTYRLISFDMAAQSFRLPGNNGRHSTRRGLDFGILKLAPEKQPNLAHEQRLTGVGRCRDAPQDIDHDDISDAAEHRA